MNRNFSWLIALSLCALTAHAQVPPITSGYGANGSFTAPMAGFHGWFFRNMEGRPVTIRVRLSGFYELRPYPPPPK